MDECPPKSDLNAWIHPKSYVKRSINWFISRVDEFESVPEEAINPFYHIKEHRDKFEEIFISSRGDKFLNIVINACHHITDYELQNWLMVTAQKRGTHTAEFMITDLLNFKQPGSKELSELRNTIWQMIR
jgi:hypothetical protein